MRDDSELDMFFAGLTGKPAVGVACLFLWVSLGPCFAWACMNFAYDLWTGHDSLGEYWGTHGR